MGGADVGRTVWRVGDNLEKTLQCKFLFLWAKFLYLYILVFITDDGHVMMELM